MTDMLKKLQIRLPQEQDASILQAMLEDAIAFILAYTGRDTLPGTLESAAVQLAIIYYDRRGIEGESRRDEGGIVRVMDALPRDITAMLNPHRLAKAVE